ncbi:MAG: nucleotidyltransferase family protein [Oscillospiraceae bacterium]|jgi:predicted nucleotidyltransferase|nr:nucleotidyltransferase family protein [Oscillospiraceae bacterium]
MKTAGIICEYNPFHNGHLYHINQTRQTAGATHTVGIMSGNFVQRGDIALFNKFDRAEFAVRHGIDLVIELPTVYALSSAEYFAAGAIEILNALGCVDLLSFGSECGRIESLEQTAELCIKAENSPELLRLLKAGNSYPAAMHDLIRKDNRNAAEVLAHPNNLLGIEYIKALKASGSAIKPITVLRSYAPHDSGITEDIFSSSSYLRELAENAPPRTVPAGFNDYVPESLREPYTELIKSGLTAAIGNLERTLLYKLRCQTAENLAQIRDVEQGLENVFIKARKAVSLPELMEYLKSRRYPHARLRRILLNMLLGIKREDMRHIKYIRVLAINEHGTQILRKAKETCKLPVVFSSKDLKNPSAVAARFAEIDALACDIYALACGSIQPSGTDFTHNPAGSPGGHRRAAGEPPAGKRGICPNA